MKAFIYKPDVTAQFVEMGLNINNLQAIQSFIDDGYSVVVVQETTFDVGPHPTGGIQFRTINYPLRAYFSEYVQLSNHRVVDQIVFYQHGFKVINTDGTVAAATMNENSDFGEELVSFDFQEKACALCDALDTAKVPIAEIYYKNLVGTWVGYGCYVNHEPVGYSPSLNVTVEDVSWENIPASSIDQDAVLKPTSGYAGRTPLMAPQDQTIAYGLTDWAISYAYNGYAVSTNQDVVTGALVIVRGNIDKMYVAR